MSILDERELGTIPVSIGTALAIDGLYDRHPENKSNVKGQVKLAKVIYINARTLFRNMFGAIGDVDKANSIQPKDYGEALLKELDELKIALSNENDKLNVVLYMPSYKSLAKYMGNGELKPLNTEKQKRYNNLENDTLQYIFNKFKDAENKPFIDVDMQIKVDLYQPIFIMTHLPVDLLNVDNASEVFLVESHTGKVKNKNLWYSKFSTERSPRIPFNKATLLFFGDSGGMFKAQNSKARKRVLAIADDRKWNSFTTITRIFTGLELSHEPVLLSTFKALSR